MLTVREKEILCLLKTGASNSEIAAHFSIDPVIIGVRLWNIFKKMEVSNRFQATLWTFQHL